LGARLPAGEGSARGLGAELAGREQRAWAGGGKRLAAVAEPLARGRTGLEQRGQAPGSPRREPGRQPARARPRSLPAELHASRCQGPCMAALPPGVLLVPSPSCCWPWLGDGRLREAWLGQRASGSRGDRPGRRWGGGIALPWGSPFSGSCVRGGRAVVVCVPSPLYPSADAGDASGSRCPGAGSAILCSLIPLHPPPHLQGVTATPPAPPPPLVA